MLKNILSWFTAFIAAFILVNGVLYLYERPVGWIDTPNGASRAVRHPYSILVHGSEGYGISQIDSNGYTNPDKPLADSYILMMGSSHTQGKEVASDKKYSVLVNDAISNDDKLHTYNIACDGMTLDTILGHFKSAVTNYPNAEYITIEILGTDYSAQELNDMIPTDSKVDLTDARHLFSTLSTRAKIKNYIKETFPITSIIKSHIETWKSTVNVSDVSNESVELRGDDVDFDMESRNGDDEEYRVAVENVITYMRQYYDGKIVFVYHPTVALESDGTLTVNRSETINLFTEACNNLGVDIIDTGEEFISYYKQYHKLPYGFSNTACGSGHLNEAGHKIVADAIVRYLEENQ